MKKLLFAFGFLGAYLLILLVFAIYVSVQSPVNLTEYADTQAHINLVKNAIGIFIILFAMGSLLVWQVERASVRRQADLQIELDRVKARLYDLLEGEEGRTGQKKPASSLSTQPSDAVKKG